MFAFEIALGVLAGVFGADEALPVNDRWLHPACKPLDCTRNGVFLQKADGSLLSIEAGILYSSTDNGKTWTPIGSPIDPGVQFEYHGHIGQFIETKSGALVVLYLDIANYKWGWNEERNEPDPDVKLELWSIRSIDGGKTWIDKQCLLTGYNADFMGLIQTSQGRLVVVNEHLVPELKRWVALSFASDDDGVTWKRSNSIDLGGRGHHDGALEPTVVELKDGRVMMWIRTNLGRFWKAYSDDGGIYWRCLEPSNVDASSAPSWLARLASGRLALVWNRIKAEDATEVTYSGKPGCGHENNVSWYRAELSIAFSEDDGKTWSQPVVIARQPSGQLAYPYFLERNPGELWVFTRYTFLPGGKPAAPLMVSLKEEEFLRPTPK